MNQDQLSRRRKLTSRWPLFLVLAATALLATKCLGDSTGLLIVKVYNSKTSAPIEGVSVTFCLDGGKIDAASTDKNGSASASWVGPGTMDVRVVFSKEGYPDKEVTVAISDFSVDSGGNAVADMEVRLTPKQALSIVGRAKGLLF